MENIKTAVYKYRWVVLITYMLINLVVQMQWVALVPVSSAAGYFYSNLGVNVDWFGAEGLGIDFFAMSFMLFYIIFCFPASYVLDNFGLRAGLGIGAGLAIAGGVLKVLFPANFWVVFAAQMLFAVGQPFILNAVTAVSGRWFPMKERGTATGLATLSQFLGIIAAMILTPYIVSKTMEGDTITGVTGIETMHIAYGILTIVVALASLLLIKSRPQLPPSVDELERTSFKEGFKVMFKSKDMLITIGIFLIGLGLFNALTGIIEDVCVPKGFDMVQSGWISSVMLMGGVVGALVIPILSDYFKKRKLFMIISLAGMIPALAGFVFSTTYAGVLAASAVLGFFILSAGPIGFQYAAEVSFPTPESSSQGVILFIGQVSGLVFIGLMLASATMMKVMMIAFIVLGAVALGLTFLLKESPMIITEKDKAEGNIPHVADVEKKEAVNQA